MAIFHTRFSNISNGKGRGAVASASYRSGESLYDEKEGKEYFYKRSIQPECYILKPSYAPEWCLDRQRLWNEVEKKENKVNSRYAKEFNVALPIELDNEEQKELLLNYVQKNFVDEGMVADIAIHRDHEENPHAHVMLTNRPFNQDGTWGQKSKTEYILDEKGNQTYTKNGNLRQRKIWLVNWDKPGMVEKWNDSWADMVNEQLKKKGLTERISSKSYKEQGINQEPTIHIGVKKNKNRIAYNEAIKNKRKNQKNYDELNRKIGLHKHNNLFKNNLSYQERHQLAELSKELKTYVDFENINDKRGMIENWKNSVLVKKIMGVNVNRQIALINKTELNIQEANQLLNKVAERMTNKLYPQLENKNLSIYEKRELIQKTINDDRIYQGEELPEKINEIRQSLLDKRVVTLTRRPMVNLRLLEKWNDKNFNQLNKLIEKYNVTADELIKGKNTDKLSKMDEDKKAEVGKLIKNIRNNNTLKNIINEQYRIVLTNAFPDIQLNQLDNSSKELLYMYTMYYNPELKSYSNQEIKQLVKNTPPKFIHEEHQIGLKVLDGEKKLDTVKNEHLKRVLKQQGLKQMFIYECREDKKLNQDEVSKIRKKFMSNEAYIDKQRKEIFEDYKPLNYGDLTATKYREITISDTIINDLMQEDYSKYEREHHKAEERKLEQELTRKQRKGKNQERNYNPHL